MGLLLATAFMAVHVSAASLETTAYQKAVVRAAMHELPSANLLKLSESKRRINMVTWTNQSYHKGNHVLQDDIWFVQKNQLKKLCKHSSKKITPSKIEQLLGMPPLSNYRGWHLVVMKVPNQQAVLSLRSHFTPGVFRPCFSTDSIRQSYCTYQPDMNLPRYDAWVLMLSLTQFRLKGGYPWTGLGYTYNWDPQAKSIIGLSEFIVTRGTEVTILGSQTPNQFCNLG